jgi:CDP-diacylglycerol--glycerol-3-phosphate 3-phosphatidyltransferase
MFARDMLVEGLRMLATSKQIVIAASKLGKLKTVSQMLAITLIIINFKIDNLEIYLYFTILATAISVISGIDYYLKNYKDIFNDHT